MLSTCQHGKWSRDANLHQHLLLIWFTSTNQNHKHHSIASRINLEIHVSFINLPPLFRQLFLKHGNCLIFPVSLQWQQQIRTVILITNMPLGFSIACPQQSYNLFVSYSSINRCLTIIFISYPHSLQHIIEFFLYFFVSIIFFILITIVSLAFSIAWPQKSITVSILYPHSQR